MRTPLRISVSGFWRRNARVIPLATRVIPKKAKMQRMILILLESLWAGRESRRPTNRLSKRWRNEPSFDLTAFEFDLAYACYVYIHTPWWEKQQFGDRWPLIGLIRATSYAVRSRTTSRNSVSKCLNSRSMSCRWFLTRKRPVLLAPTVLSFSGQRPTCWLSIRSLAYYIFNSMIFSVSNL